MEALQKDRIVAIEKHREKSIGAAGRMLLPHASTVEAVLKQVPKGQLISIEQIRDKLAKQFKVDATCPFNTKLCFREIANRSNTKTAYWRVVRKNGELIKYFPDGLKGHGVLLKGEGFAVDAKNRVKEFKRSLVN